MRRIGALLAIMVPVMTHAGAWTQPQGQGLFITQATYYTADSYFDSNGDNRPQPRYTKRELQPYVEYGLTDAITIGGTAYLDAVEQSGTDNRGLADPQVFVRARVYHDEKRLVSLEPLLKLPSSFDDPGSPQGGSRSKDLELSVRYGSTLPMISSNDYTDMRLGYRTRSLGLSDQLLLDLAFGLKPNETWEITPALRITAANSAADSASFSENGELDYNLVKAELGALYHLTHTQWLQATFFDHVAGVQTGNGFGFSLAFAQRF